MVIGSTPVGLNLRVVLKYAKYCLKLERLSSLLYWECHSRKVDMGTVLLV